MQEALLPQQYLYTVVERDAQVDKARIIGSMTDYLFAPEDPERVLQALADVDTRIVSLTITEGGYNLDQTTGTFLAAAPGIQESAGSSQPWAPCHAQ